jgi:hypothetical protein
LGLSVAREEGVTTAMARWRARGSARPVRRRRKGGRGKGACGLVGRLGLLGRIGPLGQMAAGLEERKRKIEIYFEIDF